HQRRTRAQFGEAWASAIALHPARRRAMFFMKWTMGPPDTWNKTRAFLESIPASLPEKPQALLVISGHWEENVPTVGAAKSPELIYDYSGFPSETYQLTWPAPGSPNWPARFNLSFRKPAWGPHRTIRAVMTTVYSSR